MADRYPNIFVGGEWVPTREGRTDRVLDPSTGEVLAEVASADAADMAAAVAAADRPQVSKARSAPAERGCSRARR